MLKLASSTKYFISHDYDHKKRGQVMLKDLSLAQSGNVIIGCCILGLLGSRTTVQISGLPRLLSKHSRIHDGKCPRPSREGKLNAHSLLSASPANPEKGQNAITNSEAPLFNIHECHLKRLRSVMTAGKGTSVVIK
ncbi:hypothetical protein GE21DRAFT_9006 [Neurospora crassa]|uniref:Uncharacterized protein n=1 Tax=Neurospora crassa (strain ATCC 24698 / 74-OR23-1A / CBS 708.71 / DSM 1257 / FGSC 987) TaxID=367110 RepID=Q7S6R9_NEUCR|nr:hypothetical protein NCU05520 [Neurospora crassa OR74A]EAA31246.1 hypothetical protein NCU05520 [Neurospora crassa OR74A]KHE81670.1 hypothetical protein GE21DRAFT_9006 [Neurospora crassa]|eukprot:XP_960482.1 hypothetical protein NCU05520 [Neurospora crassa OR74A]